MARPQQGCTDHGQPGHICNHSPSSIAENLDEIEFSRSIHAACISNNLTRVQTILSKGNSRGVSPANALDTAGYTALHYASRAGNKEICTLLLNAGADIDAKTPELGATPLMRAVQQNHIAIARLLVSYGASIDDHNADQENVFHIVAVAASGGMNNNNDPEVFLELVRWLRIKADSQEVMSDSQYCQVHWRDADLINIETEWESEDLPDDSITVPLNEQPASTEESEQAFFEQQIMELEQKWMDQDLPAVADQREPSTRVP